MDLRRVLHTVALGWALLCLAPPPVFAQSPEFSRMAVSDIRDLEASVTVVKADLPQLEKINKDFGIAYRLREVTIHYKEPDKFRMDSRLGMLVVNGPTRYLRVPQLGIRRRDDVGQSLSRRHSLLDLGLITVSRLDQFVTKFLRTEAIRDRSVHAFELKLKDADSDRYVVWVDPDRKIILRRRWLDAEGQTRATFDYLEPREVAPGLWLPTRIEVRNPAGELAGTTAYTEIKVNQDPPDELFAIEGGATAKPATQR